MAKATISGPVVIKTSDDGKIHISYIPGTRQVLIAGKEYEFIVEGITDSSATKVPVEQKRSLEEDIEYMVLMTQTAIMPCEECKTAPVQEYHKDKLIEFAKAHPDIVEGQRELWPKGRCNAPAEALIEGAHCFILGVCCGCCEKNHPDIRQICEQARIDYEKDIREERGEREG